MKKGRHREAIMAPSETYLVMMTVMVQRKNESKAGTGKSPITTPKLVETPLPPFPFRNTEKLCPAMEAIPADRR